MGRNSWRSFWRRPRSGWVIVVLVLVLVAGMGYVGSVARRSSGSIGPIPVKRPAASISAVPVCPAARLVPAEVQRRLVAHVVPPDVGSSAPAGVGARAVRQLLLSSNRHALLTRFPTLYAPRRPLFPDFAGPVTHPSVLALDRAAKAVKEVSSQALALAVSTEAGAYDARIAGRPIGYARGVAVWLVRALACRHAAISAGGWGAGDNPLSKDLHEWLSPLTAMQVGTAGWLLWGYLSDVDRFRVAAMVTNEADRLAAVPPAYYGAPGGAVLRPGDTKAEEDAWVGTIFTLAASMMPHHPHATRWRHQQVRFQLAAYATRADATAATRVHGAALRSWLAGWNLYPDGTVINHHLIHPLYATAITWNSTALAVHGLGGSRAPRAALQGLDLVYGSLLHRTFAAPPFRAPGGTVYRPGSGAPYFPQGNDWGSATVVHFLLLDTAARVTGTNPAAAPYQLRHARVLAAMQARASDGRSYQSLAEYKTIWNQETDAELLAWAWLLERAAANGRTATDDADYSAPGAVPAAAVSGAEWTQYQPAMPPPARAGQSIVLAAPRQSTTTPAELPVVTVLPDRGAVSVHQRASGPHTVPATVDVLFPARAPADTAYLLHLPGPADPARATVIRQADGHQTCELRAQSASPGPARLLTRVPLNCLGGRAPRAPAILLTATISTGPAAEPLPTLLVRWY
jgi:hypothetical protein